MTELDQGSSHIQVIDANPIKGIMNKQMIKVEKNARSIICTNCIFRLQDFLMYYGFCF